MNTLNTPWEAQIDWAPDFPNGSYVFDSHGNELAGPIGGFDACLMAAAPDLLAALEALFSAPNDYHLSHCWEIARAAIKKAKGE